MAILLATLAHTIPLVPRHGSGCGERPCSPDVARVEQNIGFDSLERLALAFGLTIPDLLQAVDAQTIGETPLTKIRTR